MLSTRELQVLEMIARGYTNRGIAAELGITVHAVKFHLGSIFRKLGVVNRTEAAVAYLRDVPTPLQTPDNRRVVEA